jgi:PAS domain S-box-containing protein
VKSVGDYEMNRSEARAAAMELPVSALADALGVPDRAILDALPAAVYATDAQGIVTYYNRAAAELAGREPVIGKDKWCVTWRLFNPDGTPLPHDKCPMAIALREKRPVRGVEAVIERPDGRRFPFMPYPTPLFAPNGELIGAVNMLVDISDRKAVEAEIQSQNDRLAESAHARRQLAAIVESSEDAIASKDLNGIIVSWNKGAERLFGYAADEIIGQPVTTLMPEDRQNEEPAILERIRRGERVEHYETVRQRKDGTLIDISLTVSPVRDEDGRIVGASKIARDITARKRTEAALARHADEQAALFQLSDGLNRAERLDDVYAAALDAIVRALRCDRASILLSDDQGVMRFVAWRGLSEGYRRAVEGHSPWKPDDKDPQPVSVSDVAAAVLPPALKATILDEGIHATTFIPLVANGRLIGKFMAYFNDPHAFTDGEVDVAMAVARQLAFAVTKKRAEDELRTNEERLRLATQAGRVGVWEWDLATDEVTWTDSLYAIHGLAKGTFAGTAEAVSATIHPEDRSRVAAAARNCIATGQPYEIEFRIQRPNGQVAWVFSTAAIVREDGKPTRLVGALIDITERKSADAQRDLLVAELSHRVKNTLATVISIAHQSFSKGPSIEEARQSFDGRIRALAHTHGRLAEGNWSGVSFETIVLDELLPYRHEDGGNVRIRGPKITLAPKQAVILGMAFHELATNAAKHGALSAKSGAVDIAWDFDRPGSALRIRWAETGGPTVVPPRRSGFGRLLLERALASDLQGTVALDFAARGLTCDITVPLDASSVVLH